jgi:hypothetical protein
LKLKHKNEKKGGGRKLRVSTCVNRERKEGFNHKNMGL